MLTAPPAALPLPEAAAFPPALLLAPHWVGYALEERDGALTKIPKDPRTGRNAKSNDAATWTDFHAARAFAAGRGLGVGLMLAPPLIGIDLDDCRDPATGQLTPLATSVLGELETYAEISVSGTGVKAIGYGVKPGTRCRRTGLQIEIYDHARLFALTGQRLPDAPLAVGDVHEAIGHIYGVAFPPPPPAPPWQGPVTPTNEDDAAVLDWLHEHIPGFTAQWNGPHGKDPSGDDLALCNRLAWRTGDPHRVDRLFRQSGLLRPKWDERRPDSTYGEMTVAKAFDGRTRFYEPRHAAPHAQSVILTDRAPAPTGDDQVADFRAMAHDQLADVAAAQAAQLAALQAQLAFERRRADQATEMLSNVMQIRRNRHIRAERDTLVAAVLAYAEAPKDEAGYAATPAVVLADAVGRSPKAASEHLARGHDWDLLDRKIVTERHTDPASGAVTLRSSTRIKLLATPQETLRILVTLKPKRINKETGEEQADWGGKRDTCPACGKDDTYRETRVVCRGCGHVSAPLEAPIPGPVILTGQETAPAGWAAIMGVAVPASDPPAPRSRPVILTGPEDAPTVATFLMAEVSSGPGRQGTLGGSGGSWAWRSGVATGGG